MGSRRASPGPFNVTITTRMDGLSGRQGTGLGGKWGNKGAIRGNKGHLLRPKGTLTPLWVELGIHMEYRNIDGNTPNNLPRYTVLIYTRVNT